MGVGETLDFRIPSDVQYIEEIVEEVVGRCRALEYSHRQLALNVPVALTEALSNAILRGNGDDVSRTVWVRIQVDREQLIAEVRDEGDGFDLDGCTEDATLPENLVREDGRGLFLMQKLVDRVERFSDGGNVVRLVLVRVAAA